MLQPLSKVRVIDFSKVLAGPLCAQILSDLGAEVIKIEPVEGGDDTRRWPPFEEGESTIFLSVNRNKRSIAIDLKSEAGLALCKRLIESADVVIESFGPGVAERLGVGYEAACLIKPDLIYCNISGYGSVGPKREDKGYDLIAQAFTGMMSVTGERDGPPVRSPFSPVDQATGMNAAIGILGGLMHRTQTGKGLKLEAALFDTAVGFLAYFLQSYWQRGTEPGRNGSGHESLCPYKAFDTADLPLILGVANDTFWRSFCEAANAPDLAQDARFTTGADRVRHREACEAAVAKLLLQRTRAQWLETLQAMDIPCSPVHNLGELSEHPHTLASGMILHYQGQSGQDLKGVALPLRIDGERLALRSPPPKLGANTADILKELGLDEAQIEKLVSEGVVSLQDARHQQVASPR